MIVPCSPEPERNTLALLCGSASVCTIAPCGPASRTRPTRPAPLTTIMPACTPSSVPRSICSVRLNASGPRPTTAATTVRRPNDRWKSSAWRSSLSSYAAALSSASWRCKDWFSAFSLSFSVVTLALTQKIAVARPTVDASDIICASSGAIALLTVPRAPSAHDCWDSTARRSIAAAKPRKRPVERDRVLPCMGNPLRTQGSRAPCAQQHPVQSIDVLEDDAGAADHACERVFGHSHRHEGFVREQLVQSGEQRASAADDHAALDDVLDQLMWRRVECRADRAHDVDEHAAQRLAHVCRCHLHCFRQPRDEVAPADDKRRLVGHRES